MQKGRGGSGLQIQAGGKRQQALLIFRRLSIETDNRIERRGCSQEDGRAFLINALCLSGEKSYKELNNSVKL